MGGSQVYSATSESQRNWLPRGSESIRVFRKRKLQRSQYVGLVMDGFSQDFFLAARNRISGRANYVLHIFDRTCLDYFQDASGIELGMDVVDKKRLRLLRQFSGDMRRYRKSNGTGQNSRLEIMCIPGTGWRTL